MSDLASLGGEALRKKAWPTWPCFEQDEIDAASSVLASGKVNYWTGNECRRFEQEFADFVGRKHAIALANGTLALELALMAYDIGPGDEVIVPARTFIATASCAVMRGAIPVVADVDPVTQGLSAASISQVLTARTKAIIVVHLAGIPCDMDPIMALAEARGLVVIEDCAQAHGGSYKGRPLGAIGHCSAFSFCQDKIMTTGGEGGIFLLDDEDRWKKAWSYKDHGKSWSAVHDTVHPPGFRWLHESFGTNWRMTEMQAAIGRRQLNKLSVWSERRRANVERLSAGLAKIPGVRVEPFPEWGQSACYKYYAFVDAGSLAGGWNRTRVVDAIAAEGIPCMAGTCSEIYREKAFVNAGLGPAAPHPVAVALGETSVMFQVHHTLTDAEIDDTCAAVAKVMAVAAAGGL